MERDRKALSKKPKPQIALRNRRVNEGARAWLAPGVMKVTQENVRLSCLNGRIET